MNEPSINRWAGKSTEDVLAESYHELRGRIVNATGYLNVLKAIHLSPEEAQHYIDMALKHALSAQDIVDSVYQYMDEKRKDQ